MQETDVVVLGAGAAGLMCAAQAGYRGRKVVVLDHGRKPGKKILMSGGGRCNFTNRSVSKDNYVCANPHFVISALKRFGPEDFIELVERHGIDYHERDWGQLFCDHSSKAIVDLLLTECEWAQVAIHTRTSIRRVERQADDRFLIHTGEESYLCQSLVVATGGLSFANAGASPLGYDIARQFDIPVIPTEAALVPFTLPSKQLALFKPLAGVAVQAQISCNGQRFRENLLFTHRGFSGPVVLQVSNYWRPGDSISIDLFPDLELTEWLQEQQQQRPKAELRNILGEQLTKRLAQTLCTLWECDRPLGRFSPSELEALSQRFQNWRVKPAGTEGYRTAEVTRGGVDTDYLSSKTLEAKSLSGLYFVGEVVDVTGWLGGYNFQWAWASGYCAGQYV